MNELTGGLTQQWKAVNIINPWTEISQCVSLQQLVTILCGARALMGASAAGRQTGTLASPPV